MRVLVVGAAGQLGRDVVDVLAQNSSLAVLGIDLPEIDITDPQSVELVFGGFDPDFVINCAAYTAVDDAEENEDLALRVNGLGPRLIAQECHKASAWLVHVSPTTCSTARRRRPTRRTRPRTRARPTDAPSSLARRRFARSCRTRTTSSARPGCTACHGSNFVKTMLRLEGERDTVSVVDDQRGQPTYSRDLARQIVQVFEKHPAAGTYHGTNSGEVTWFGFTREIFRLAGADPARVLPTTSAEFVRAGPRPSYSVLGHDRWEGSGIPQMRPWQEALAAAFADGISAG